MLAGLDALNTTTRGAMQCKSLGRPGFAALHTCAIANTIRRSHRVTRLADEAYLPLPLNSAIPQHYASEVSMQLGCCTRAQSTRVGRCFKGGRGEGRVCVCVGEGGREGGTTLLESAKSFLAALIARFLIDEFQQNRWTRANKLACIQQSRLLLSEVFRGCQQTHQITTSV